MLTASGENGSCGHACLLALKTDLQQRWTLKEQREPSSPQRSTWKTKVAHFEACRYGCLCLVAQRPMLSTTLINTDVGRCCVDDQPSRSTPEAEQPIFVYRLLRKKEVNKDLVHQEVWLELHLPCHKSHIKTCQLHSWLRRSMCYGQTTESGTRQRLSRCSCLCSAATALASVAPAWHHL